MSPSAESLIRLVERRSRDVVRLAELLGPAVRIEAALVRRLRVDLLPHLPAEVEAALWFSPLVQAHSADGIALSVPVAVAFRQRLKKQWENTGRRALLEEAREIYADVHAYLPPPLRLEEEVAWSLIAGDTEEAERQLARAVAAFLAEPDRFRFWAGQAAARLPDGVSATASGERLTRAAGGEEPSGPDWEMAYRALGTKPLVVRYVNAQIEFGGPAGPGCRSIAVPDMAQISLELRWPPPGSGPVEHILVDSREEAPPVQARGSGHVEVRTASGVSYLVRNDPFDRPCRIQPAADPRGELRSMVASSSVPGLRLPEDDEAAEICVALRDGRAVLEDGSRRAFPGLPRLDPGDGGFASRAVTVAAHVSRWLTVAELRSGSPVLAGAIELTVTGPGVRSGQPIELTPTGHATVTITNASTETLFVSVLARSSDWSVRELLGDGRDKGLPPGARQEATLRLDVLGHGQSEGFVQLTGVAARHPFDPSPLALPPIGLDAPPMPPARVPVPSSTPTLNNEFAIMVGAPFANPVPRYLEWTTHDVRVTVRQRAGDVGEDRRQVIVRHDGPVYAVAFSPDGALLATGSGDRSARLLDAVTCSELRRLRNGGDVYAVAFSPDGARLAVGRAGRSVRVYEVASGSELQRFRHGGDVYAVAFSPDGALLASASQDGTVRVWDAARGEQRSETRVYKNSVRAMAFTYDGASVAAAAQNGAVVLWDVRDGRTRRFEPDDDPDVTNVVTVGRDGSLRSSLSQSWLRGLPEVVAGASRSALQGDLSVVAFSPDGTSVTAAGRDGTIRLWDVVTGRPRGVLRDDSGLLRVMALSPDGRVLAAVGRDGVVRFWEVTTGRPRAVIPGPAGQVNALAFSPDGTRLAVAGEDGSLLLWDADLWLRPAPEEWASTPESRSLFVIVAVAQPPGLVPLPDMDADADLLADQMGSRGLDVTKLTGELAVGERVREVLADLRHQAVDLLVLYVAGHGSPTSAGPALVLADGTSLGLAEFGTVTSAARRTLVILDTDEGPSALDALDGAAAEATSADRSLALLASLHTRPGGSSLRFAEALVAALARTDVADSRLVSTLEERLAAGGGGSRVTLGSSGPPISLPPLEAIPATSNALAAELATRGDLAGARDLYQSVCDTQRRLRGPDHPDTLLAVGRLARSLRGLGEYRQARDLDEDTLSRRRRVLGVDHPKTLVSASNLAADLRGLGEYRQARDLDEDTLSRRRRVLGEDHPKTRISARNLARDLRELSKVSEGDKGTTPLE